METMIFTIQEKSVMKLMMNRKSDSVIAGEMHIKAGAVKMLKANIFFKLLAADISPDENKAYWKICE